MSETPARYTTDSGAPLPSVTEILTDVLGNQWAGHTQDWHMARGSACHALYAIMGRGESLGGYEWDARLAGYVEAWRDWQAQNKPEFLAVECRVQYREVYAGTFDALVRINGKTWLIDYKNTSTPRDALQLAGYALAWSDQADAAQAKIDGFMSIEIKETGWRVAGRWTGTAEMTRLRNEWLSVMRVHGLKKRYARAD